MKFAGPCIYHSRMSTPQGLPPDPGDPARDLAKAGTIVLGIFGTIAIVAIGGVVALGTLIYLTCA